jgi:Family of unknown function (DUF5996)
VSEDRQPLGSSADVHELREDRLWYSSPNRHADPVTALAATRPQLPELPLVDWEKTKDTLHLWCQIVGKVRMASTAPRNHW